MAKKESEQDKMDNAYQKSTGMNVVKPTPTAQGETTFAKDVYKNTETIQSNPGNG